MPSFSMPAIELIQKPSFRTAAIAWVKPVGLGLFFFHFPPSSCLLPLLLPLRRSCRCSVPGAYSLLPLCSSDCSDPLRNGGRPAPPSCPPTQVTVFPCSVLIFGKWVFGLRKIGLLYGWEMLGTYMIYKIGVAGEELTFE